MKVPLMVGTRIAGTLFSYVVETDSGFAPNPFFGVCTLARCKPSIRRAVGNRLVLAVRSVRHSGVEAGRSQLHSRAEHMGSRGS